MTDLPQRIAPGRFPVECRRFLGELSVHAENAEAPAHAAECSRCGAHLRAARGQVALLRTQLPVAAPGDAAQGLEAVYDRSIHIGERRLGKTLRQALEPTRAPADAVWQEATEPAHLGPILRRLWPARPAPGWMWRRIRAELPPRRHGEAWITPARLGLAAAAIMVSALVLFTGSKGPARIGGTRTLEDIVWDLKSEPIDPSFSLHALVQIGR